MVFAISESEGDEPRHFFSRHRDVGKLVHPCIQDGQDWKALGDLQVFPLNSSDPVIVVGTLFFK